MSKADGLTGLATRTQQKADTEKAIANGPAALALIDIDYFVEINDKHGHEAGDQVLVTLAGLLAEAGQAYRISGDEFAVLMPGKSLEQAFLAMEALRQRVSEARERFALPHGGEVTVTVGVAQCPRDAKDEPSLHQAAQAALMSAKESGRNQVALPPNEEMVMKSCYYPAASIRRLKGTAERLGKKESALLREALDDLLRKYDK